jgi:hypothetical protein
MQDKDGFSSTSQHLRDVKFGREVKPGSYELELRNGVRLTAGRQYKRVIQQLLAHGQG